MSYSSIMQTRIQYDYENVGPVNLQILIMGPFLDSNHLQTGLKTLTCEDGHPKTSELIRLHSQS